MDSKPQKKSPPPFFLKNMGVTLSLLQLFSEYKARWLLRSLSKNSCAFLKKHDHHIQKICLPTFPDTASLRLDPLTRKADRVVFNKGLRQHHQVVKVMWVKEQLFVLAYKDYTFDLYDIDQLQKY